MVLAKTNSKIVKEVKEEEIQCKQWNSGTFEETQQPYQTSINDVVTHYTLIVSPPAAEYAPTF